MKTEEKVSTTSLKIFAALGVIGLITIPFVIGLFFWILSESVAQDIVVESNASRATDQNFSASSTVEGYIQVGESCTEKNGMVCLPNLYCHIVQSKGSCAAKNDAAPHILSARFEGLQPQNTGMYLAMTNKPIGISVDAVHAKSARVEVLPIDGVSSVTHMTTSDQVTFETSIVLPEAFKGKIILTIESKEGHTNSLVKRVAFDGDTR